MKAVFSVYGSFKNNAKKNFIYLLYVYFIFQTFDFMCTKDVYEGCIWSHLKFN